MNDSKRLASAITLSTIIKRKLSFLLDNNICPWEGNNTNLGERDALEQLLADSTSMVEEEFEEKYLLEIARLKRRIEGKIFSVADNDDYYESFSNTIIEILSLINPKNLYDFDDGK